MISTQNPYNLRVEDAAPRSVEEAYTFLRQAERQVDEYRALRRREKSDPIKDKDAAERYADDPQKWSAYFLGHYYRTRPHEGAEWHYTPPAKFHSDIFRLCKDRNDPEWRDSTGLVKRGVFLAAPRGFSKSTIVSLFLILWWICTKQRTFIILLSNTDDQAMQISENIQREILENERLKNAYGDMRPKLAVTTIGGDKIRQPWSKHNFTVVVRNERGKIVHTTRIISKGTGGKLRGFRFKEQRPDAVILDDVENDENVESKPQRDKIHNWVMGALLPMMDPHTGIFIMVGTILHDDSVLNRFLKKGMEPDSPYIARVWRAIQADGTSLWPERFPLPVLKQMRRGVTVLKFNQEYLNNPRDPAQNVFKPESVSWWYLHDIRYDSKTHTYYWKGLPLRITIGVDPAIADEEDKRADAEEKSQFALVVVGSCVVPRDSRRRVLALRAAAADLDFAEQVKTIRLQTQRWNPARVGIETNGYQKALRQHLQTVMGEIPVLELPHDARAGKDKRIISTSWFFDQKLVLLRAAEPEEKGEPDEMQMVRVHESERAFYDSLMRYPRIGRFDTLDAWEMALRAQSGKRAFEDWAGIS